MTLFPKNIAFLSLKIDFVHTLMKCCIILHCLQKYQIWGFQYINALKTMIYSPKFMKNMGLYFVAVSLDRWFDISLILAISGINRSTFSKCCGMEQVKLR